MEYCSRIIDFIFFKQTPAYDVRISDWSSDVCSSDLSSVGRLPEGGELTTLRALLANEPAWVERHLGAVSGAAADDREQPLLALNTAMMMNGFVLRLDRESVGWGRIVSVRVDLGGSRMMTKKI